LRFGSPGGSTLQHERQIDVALCVADVDAAVDARLGNVEERVSEPQQTAHDHVPAASFQLQTPRAFHTTTKHRVVSMKIRMPTTYLAPKSG